MFQKSEASAGTDISSCLNLKIISRVTLNGYDTALSYWNEPVSIYSVKLAINYDPIKYSVNFLFIWHGLISIIQWEKKSLALVLTPQLPQQVTATNFFENTSTNTLEINRING